MPFTTQQRGFVQSKPTVLHGSKGVHDYDTTKNSLCYRNIRHTDLDQSTRNRIQVPKMMSATASKLAFSNRYSQSLDASKGWSSQSHVNRLQKHFQHKVFSFENPLTKFNMKFGQSTQTKKQSQIIDDLPGIKISGSLGALDGYFD